VPNVDATLMQLTDDEQSWIQGQLAVVDRFVGDYGPADGAGAAEGLEGVDQAWAAWLESGPRTEADDPDSIINAVAVALGQAVVEALDGFMWVTVFEDGETDLAVTGLPAVDLLFHPAEVVALEYQAHNATFLVQTRDHLIEQVRGTPE